MSEWKTIETAPKDGTKILIWKRRPFSSHEIVYWDHRIDSWVTQDEMTEIGSKVPSHWMALSEPAVTP